MAPHLIVFAALLVLGTWQPADAQTVDRPFSDLGRYLNQGGTVFVVERERGETRGTLERLSTTALVLLVDGTQREFDANEVGWIDKFPDRFWDDAVWGALFGYASILGVGTFMCASYPDVTVSDCTGFITSGSTQRLAAKFAGISAGVGLLIDLTKRERRLVFGTRPGQARTQFRAARPAASLADLWSRVRPGDTVYVRESSGREIKGIFSRASESSLTVVVNGQASDIPGDRVQQVRRRTSQFWRGMVVGPIAGAVYGAANPAQYSSRSESAAAGASLGWALGTIVGAGVPRRTTVYGTETPPALSVMPVLTPRGISMTLSLRF